MCFAYFRILSMVITNEDSNKLSYLKYYPIGEANNLMNSIDHCVHNDDSFNTGFRGISYNLYCSMINPSQYIQMRTSSSLDMHYICIFCIIACIMAGLIPGMPPAPPIPPIEPIMFSNMFIILGGG